MNEEKNSFRARVRNVNQQKKRLSQYHGHGIKNVTTVSAAPVQKYRPTSSSLQQSHTVLTKNNNLFSAVNAQLIFL